MDTLFAVIVGVGFAASCGFRVFVPMLVMSLAVRAGQLELSEGWGWVGSWPAIVAFSVATVVEIVGFYIPWLDTLLDTLATPAAVIAGTISAAACISDMSPLLQWSTAIIAGGGVAGIVQSTTVVARGASTGITAGASNFVVSSVELVMSTVLSVLTVVAPLIAGLGILLVGIWIARFLLRRVSQRQPQSLP